MVNENITGHEWDECYDNDRKYWVLCKLSKKERRLQVANAINASLKLFNEAQEKEFEKSFADALLKYIDAFKAVENYFDADWNNQKINVPQDSYTAIQKILKQIEIKPDEEYDFKLAKTSNKIVKANVSYVNPIDQKKYPVSGISIDFSFIKGKGDISSKSWTKNSGKAECGINNISSSEKIQIIKAEIDIMDLIPEIYRTELIQEIFGSLVKPSTEIVINISPLTFYVVSEEYNLNIKQDFKYVEPVVKNGLMDYYFYTDDVNKADFILKISATTREGSDSKTLGYTGGLFGAWADFNISLINNKNNIEMYKRSISNMNGVGNSFSDAGIRAMQNISKEVAKSILPEIIEIINKNCR